MGKIVKIILLFIQCLYNSGTMLSTLHRLFTKFVQHNITFWHYFSKIFPYIVCLSFISKSQRFFFIHFLRKGKAEGV